MRSTNRHSFIRSLKRKGLKEEIVIKIGLYDLVTSTTLESNKSLTCLIGVSVSLSLPCRASCAAAASGPPQDR